MRCRTIPSGRAGARYVGKHYKDFVRLIIGDQLSGRYKSSSTAVRLSSKAEPLKAEPLIIEAVERVVSHLRMENRGDANDEIVNTILLFEGNSSGDLTRKPFFEALSAKLTKELGPGTSESLIKVACDDPRLKRVVPSHIPHISLKAFSRSAPASRSVRSKIIPSQQLL